MHSENWRGGNMYIWTIFIIYVPVSEATAVLIIQPTLVFPGLLVKKKQKRCKLGILKVHVWKTYWNTTKKDSFLFAKFDSFIHILILLTPHFRFYEVNLTDSVRLTFAVSRTDTWLIRINNVSVLLTRNVSRTDCTTIKLEWGRQSHQWGGLLHQYWHYLI